MSRVIWKYPIVDPKAPTIFGSCVVKMPKGAQILSLDVQYNTPVVWAKVNDDAEEFEDRTFTILQTGHEIPHSLTCPVHGAKFAGTVLLSHGEIVGHVFVTEPPPDLSKLASEAIVKYASGVAYQLGRKWRKEKQPREIPDDHQPDAPDDVKSRLQSEWFRGWDDQDKEMTN